LLHDDGVFAVLLPFHRGNYFETAAAKINLHCIKKIWVQQTPQHDYFRAILIFSKSKTAAAQTVLVIKDEEGNYTADFKNLLKDYYLYL